MLNKIQIKDQSNNCISGFKTAGIYLMEKKICKLPFPRFCIDGMPEDSHKQYYPDSQ